MPCPGGDRCGGGGLVDRICATPGAAVDGHVGRRQRGELVQRFVGPGNGLHHFAVHGGDAPQRRELNPQSLDQRGDLGGVASDHARARRVDDEPIGARQLLRCGIDFAGGRRNHPDAPVHGLVVGQAPLLPRRVAGPAQLPLKQRGRLHPTQHCVSVCPAAQREQARGLPQGVADGRLRADPVGRQRVVGQGAEGDLPQDEAPWIGVLLERRPPQQLRAKLLGEAVHAGAVGGNHVGVVQAQSLAHCRELAARAGEHQGELAVGAQRARSEAHAPGRRLVQRLRVGQ